MTFLLFIALVGQAVSPVQDNPELKQIYDADQKDREGPVAKSLDWEKINPRDAARRKRVRELIDQVSVRTGKDYERAAMVFQHGDTSDDILMAHVLAVTAIGKGNLGARWLAAASLDRYLQRLKQPQVFGTQFSYTEPKWTMEPYNRTLISPALREANCVPDLDDQLQAVQAFQQGKEPQPPKKRPCEEGRE